MWEIIQVAVQWMTQINKGPIKMEREYTTIFNSFILMYLLHFSLSPRHAYSALLTPSFLGRSDLFNKLPRRLS